MRVFARVCLLLAGLATALGKTNYASVRTRVANEYVEKVHEMASAVDVLLGLSKDTSALIAAINEQCA